MSTSTGAGGLGLGPRFEVEEELGRGAASLVLAVHDRLHDATRAIKIGRIRGQVRRYRSEFRLLREFCHPNIVRAFDYGITAHGLPYYTMELVHGKSLSGFVERSDPQTIAAIAIQVLDALATLHARGYVHRDIKPRNLLVVGHAAAALARLIDFGLLCETGKPCRAAGTLPYMAPEVARGEVVDGRADLYSLGMVIYEALLPDDMARTVEDVARGLNERPPPPSRINPVIPAGLSDVVTRLIDPDPEARYPDALAAAEALSELPGFRLGRGPVRAAVERMLRGGAVSHRTRLVRKVRRIAGAAAKEGAGRALVVQGPAGVGKSPLLRELATVLSLDGLRIAHIRTGNQPGAPVLPLLKAARALDPGAIAFGPPATEVPGQGTRAGDIPRFAGQIGVTVAAVLGREPTVLLVDDLHRAEPVALEALRSLSERLKSVPLLLVCAGAPRLGSPSFAEAFGDRAEVLQLAPLGRREVAALAAHRLRGLTLPWPALERVIADSQGMPRLVERTLARLMVDGSIRREGSRFAFAGGRYRAAPHTDGDLIAARVAEIDDAQRPVLYAAAVLGHALDARGVAEVAGTPVSQTASILAELARLEILNPGDSSSGDPIYAFASRPFAAAVYQQLSQAERRAYHDRAAALLARAAIADGRDEERVEHLLRGSDDSAAVDAATEAGDRAAAVFAERRAIDYYAQAYALLDGTADPRCAPLALRLGKLLERTGEIERAAEWYETAITAASPSQRDVEVEANLGLGAVELMRGRPTCTEAHAQRALDLTAGPSEARDRARARRLQGLVALHSGARERAESLLLSALSEFQAAGAEAEAIGALLDLACTLRRRGELVKAVWYARRAQQLARARGDPAAIAEASAVLGRGFLGTARFDAARRALRYGLKTARANGDRLRQGLVLREFGNLRLREGDTEGALARWERSLELVRATRARSDEAACLHNIGVVRARLGEYRAALTALRTALDLYNSIADVQGAAATAVEVGHTYAQLGQLGRARSMLTAAVQAAAALDDRVVGAAVTAILAWVELRAGDEAPCREMLASVPSLLAGLEDHAHRALVLMYATRCSILLGETTQAAAHADSLRVEVEEGALGDLRTMASGVRGQALAVSGDADRALELLQGAAAAAAREKLRPTEIELRSWIARMQSGTDQAARQLTRSMELMRTLTAAMPVEMAASYLSIRQARDIRAAFQTERQRIFGAVAGPDPRA